jgi:ATP-dependent DNA helicase RecG
VSLFADPRREELARALDTIRAGDRPDAVETETLDCKEDGSRRRDDGTIGGGDPRHEPTAKDIAEAAACLANSQGGSIVIGVQDAVGGPESFLGTSLDEQWLRERIWALTNPNLTVDVQATVDPDTGARLVAVFVPVPFGTVAYKCSRKYKHRVGTSCVDMASADHVAMVNRHRDWSALISPHAPADVEPAALGAARTILRSSAEPSRQALAGLPDTDLLHSLQVVRDGSLDNAGALLFVSTAPDPAPRLDYLRRIRPGGDTRRRLDHPGLAVLAAFSEIEQAFRVENAAPTSHGMTRTLDEMIPLPAAREAIVNAIMHRDWERPGPITIEHSGTQLVVTSPGAFPAGVDAGNVLTTPSRARNSHLADVMRSLRLAEREAIGVDRMYREMILIGHNPPEISVQADSVRCVLLGGEPVQPVQALIAELTDEAREDVDIALIVHYLLDLPRVDAQRLRPSLQKTVGQAQDALRRAARERLAPLGRQQIDDAVPTAHTGVPLIELARGTDNVYRFGAEVRARLRLRLPYLVTSRISVAKPFVIGLVREQQRVRAADVIELCGATPIQSSRILTDLKNDEVIVVGSARAVGQGVFYVAGPRFPAP